MIGTADARHVLVLCTDGGVMYCNRSEDESVELLEFSRLQRNTVLDQVWSIKRVGAMGDVILLRASKARDGSPITTIDVKPLTSKYFILIFAIFISLIFEQKQHWERCSKRHLSNQK